MKYGWNQQSAFLTSKEAIDRARELRKKGHKAKITKRWSPAHKQPSNQGLGLPSPKGRYIYTVWMWWKWKS